MRQMISNLTLSWRMLRRTGREYIPTLVATMAAYAIMQGFTMLLQPYIMRILFDALQSGNVPQIVQKCLLCTAFIAIMVLIYYIAWNILNEYTWKAIWGIGAYCFMAYHELPYGFSANQYDDGDVFNRISKGSFELSGIWVILVSFFAGLLGVFMLLWVSLSISWVLFIMTAIIGVVNFLCMQNQMKQQTKLRKSEEEQTGKKESAQYALLHEMHFAVMNDVQDVLIEDYQVIRQAIWEVRKQKLKAEIFNSLLADSVTAAMRIILPLILYPMQIAGAITIGMITQSFTLLESLKGGIGDLRYPLSRLVDSFVPIKRLNELLTHQEVQKSVKPTIYRGIEIKHVELELNQQHILKGVNLTITPGKKVAFVGKNGCGKSTLLRVMMGLYRPDKGKALINGQASASLSNDKRRELFSYIPSRAQLYHESGRDNVLAGADEDEDKNFFAALHGAFISQNESAFIDQNASELSGGQAQRINVARGIIHPAPFLIADEPTSSLDAGTGSLLIKNLMKTQSTVVMTIHNPAYIHYFDEIAVMKEGTIVAYGAFDEVANNASYMEWFGEAENTPY